MAAAKKPTERQSLRARIKKRKEAGSGTAKIEKKLAAAKKAEQTAKKNFCLWVCWRRFAYNQNSQETNRKRRKYCRPSCDVESFDFKKRG